LGWWGVGSGAFLVLPFLGPPRFATARLLLDTQADSCSGSAIPVHNTLTRRERRQAGQPLARCNKRVEQARSTNMRFRDAWLQRRLDLVYDGDPPREA
jgi:phospholipid-binding lipoprotein MlaA